MSTSRQAESQRSRSEQQRRLLGAYAPFAGVHDEMMGPDGAIRPHWEALLEEWTRYSPDELLRRIALAERHLADSGVSYRIRAESSLDDMLSGERAWPMSHMPLPIDEAEWRAIEAGVSQRAELLEAVLRDLYGPARLIAEGALPAAAVAGSPDYLRPLKGALAPGGQHLQLYACDLGRGPDGRWWVLGDRTQAPSGAGYALENRLAMARAFPDLYRSMNVERLASFFQGFRAGLVSGARRAEPRICLLTPGPLSETYFEQAYLARYLGFLLVEGSDLVMRDDRVHVRTIAGLKRADVIWRRIDGDYADPLELNAASRLGVAGMLHAIRRENVVVANAPGSGVVESRALMGFMPTLCRKVLGADLALPNVATWWCGQPHEREEVLSRIDDMAIASAFRADIRSSGDGEPLLVSEMPAAARTALVDAIRSRGVDYVGQEVVKISTMPVLGADGVLEPRPFALRVYATHTPDGWRVMPGGFCRTSDRLDARAVNMREGARSSDVWVLSGKPVEPVTLLPPPDQVQVRRVMGNLPSRVADNLFWLGRYLERAEGVLRLTRTLLGRLIDSDVRSPAQSDAVRRLSGLLVAWGAATGARTPVMRQAYAALYGLDHYGSAAACIREAKRTASVTRERLSVDAWRLIGDLTRRLERETDLPPTEGEGYETADRALRGLAAFAGLAEENMNRGAGWRFLEIGRRIERAVTTCRFARQFGDQSAARESLDVLLDLIDSQITYRSRYLVGVAYHPVMDMVLFDEYNPRSVAFQIARLDAEVAALPTVREDGLMEAPRRLSLRLAADVATARTDQVDKTYVLSLEQRLMGLSEAVANRYFLQSSVDDDSGKP
ncbi:MAG: circularly permuted type 2 ATP-grasp protein [Bosea sp.]|jgi:uncharacterized circularly permuted ATP-grasp superfamily protein/uncharacterized alpha-E superfamily protein|nr:circularly permuted type 2 ATP-grasp protein [Bosea sp. (in: a-proteobacteria)]